MDGQSNQFWQLLKPFHEKARAFCRRLMANRDEGDDLFQDSLVCALSGFDKLRDAMAFKSWLYRIIVNQYKNKIRRGFWRRARSLNEDSMLMTDNKDTVYLNIVRQRLKIAFQALSDDERILITLFEIQGWKLSELAELTGKSEQAVKVRLSRARAKMRKAIIKHLKKTESECRIIPVRHEDNLCIAVRPKKR
ncbi:MAG: sigma-70 family RNA polymerase sigma factor [candidate division Zixibacteria bacterium]|nr:sigma-70 family RNA polymerase sigma factor [candidate division Zixibacteria bacterium]